MSAPMNLGLSLPSPRTAYDDPFFPADLHEDCARADASLDLHAGTRLRSGAASLHLENLSRGVPDEAEVLANAHKLAAALSWED